MPSSWTPRWQRSRSRAPLRRAAVREHLGDPVRALGPSKGGRVVSSGRVGVEELLVALRAAAEPGGGAEPAP